MANPVLYHEVLLGARRNQTHFFRWFYLGWIMLQVLFVGLSALMQSLTATQGRDPDFHDLAAFAHDLLPVLITQNYIVLLIAAPVLTAGAITDEKWRGTLQYLLVTELFSWEIMVGKLIGRQYQVFLIALTPLPLICFVCVFGGLDLPALLAIGLSSMAMALAVGSMSLLASVLCRNTRDAVLAFYAAGALFYIGTAWLKSVLASLPWTGMPLLATLLETSLSCLDPLHPMGEDWNLDDPAARARRVAVSVASWSIVGMVSLGLAILLLRRACVSYLERDGKARWRPVWVVFAILWSVFGLVLTITYLAVAERVPSYLGGLSPGPWLLDLVLFVLAWNLLGLVPFGIAAAALTWTGRAHSFLIRFQALLNSSWLTRRPAIGANPISWKERNLEGIAPLAALRAMPRWLGLAVAFAASFIAALSLIVEALPPGCDLSAVGRMIAQADLEGLAHARANMTSTTMAFSGLGFVILLLASLIVSIRCSGVVSSEREKNTWEALLLTPLETRQLIRGKLWGVFSSALLYVLAYALPTFAFAVVGGAGSVFWFVVWFIVTLLAMWFVGAAGVWCSVRCKTSWRSLLATLGITYVGGFILFCLTTPVLLIVTFMMMLALMALDTYLQRFLGIDLGTRGAGTAIFVQALMLSWVLLTILFFVILAWRFTIGAEYRVSVLERTKHWREEAKHPRWSKHARQHREKQNIHDVNEVVAE